MTRDDPVPLAVAAVAAVIFGVKLALRVLLLVVLKGGRR
jgi:hypothetical protein